MGMFDKLKSKVTNNNDYNEDYDDNYYGGFDQNYDEQPMQQSEQQGYAGEQQSFGGMTMNPPTGQGSAPIGGASMAAGGMALSGSAIELKVVKPTEFKNASQIADHLLNRRTVVLNLEATDKENARRLIDFLTGVAYSIDGQIKRVANNAYVITPNNVDISGDQMRRPQQAQQPAPQPQQPASEEYYSELE